MYGARLCVSLLTASTLFLAGCAAAIPRNGIADAKLAATAEIPGMYGVRFWADDVPKDPIAEIKRRTIHMPPIARDAKLIDGRPVIETLALSGGGSDGAFGAGVLAGWTKRGDRPEFEVVTGVSAGAIIAPFAFLGPSEDRKLHVIWTQYKQSEVITTAISAGALRRTGARRYRALGRTSSRNTSTGISSTGSLRNISAAAS